ncbi:purple acid phosphatase [Artemisia annua]|uniref:Purple acid phosphatase n=1 Tax=Artemisia annua TaxID=35608 RepID=A0A2U1KJI8_ARTAN|nr:purple acid phosphatase [Artemisia annua]
MGALHSNDELPKQQRRHTKYTIIGDGQKQQRRLGYRHVSAMNQCAKPGMSHYSCCGWWRREPFIRLHHDCYSLVKCSLRFQIINQRADFAFALFTGGLINMTVTWTSGYNIDEATPITEWGRKEQNKKLSPAGTLTFTCSSMCGAPARTIGWCDPGFFHTSFFKELWPNTMYEYRMGHH